MRSYLGKRKSSFCSIAWIGVKYTHGMRTCSFMYHFSTAGGDGSRLRNNFDRYFADSGWLGAWHDCCPGVEFTGRSIPAPVILFNQITQFSPKTTTISF